MDLSVVFTFVPFSLPEPSAEGFRLKTPTLGRVLAMAGMAPGQFKVSLREIHSPQTEQDTAARMSNSGLQERKLLQNLKFLTLMDVLHSCNKF